MDQRIWRAQLPGSAFDELPPAVTPGGKSSVTSRMGGGLVLRVADPETARALGEALRGPRVQRAAERDGNGVSSGAEAAVERAAGSSGQALPTQLQRRFEQSTGADLSGVRVHTGADSAAAARAVGAQAYTVGQDIHFASGRYQPDDPFGMHLLAHEVAHTVQQQGGTAARQHKLEVSTPHDAAELEADRAADAMVRGEAVAIGGNAPALGRKDEGKDKPAGDKDKDKEEEEEEFPVGLSGLKIKGWEIPWPSKAEGINATKEWSATFPEKKEDGEKSIRANAQAAAMPGGLFLMGTVGGSLAATATASVAGNLIDLPSGKKGAKVSVAGGGKVEAKVYGQLDVGAYLGVSPLNIGASGFLKLTGSASIGAFVMGAATFGDGTWTGSVQLQVPCIAKVVGSGGIRALYQIGKTTKEIKAWQIGGDVDIAWFSCVCTATYNINDGSVTDKSVTSYGLYDLSSLFQEREPTPEEKRKYAREAQQKELDSCEGGEGCGPGRDPSEMYSDDDPSPYEVPEEDASPPEIPCDPENQSCL